VCEAAGRTGEKSGAAANALLFTGAVVDYSGETKHFVLSWRQCGESTVVYGMDGDRPKRRRR
jgi:hypothetical protein